MNLSQARLKQIIKESMHDLNWDDYFSSHRESGGEARVDDIMDKLRAGKSLSPDEVNVVDIIIVCVYPDGDPPTK